MLRQSTKKEILDAYSLDECSEEYREGWRDGISDAIQHRPIPFFAGFMMGAIIIVAFVVLLVILAFGLDMFL